MKRLLLLLLSLLLFSAAANAQLSLTAYRDVVLSSTGTPITTAAITVFLPNTTTKPPGGIFSTSVGGSLSNPFAVDSLGNYTFYAIPGVYDILISVPGLADTTIEDVHLASSSSFFLAGTSAAPSGCTVGEFYYDTTTGLITFCGTAGISVPGASTLTGNITFGGSIVPVATGQDIGSPTVRPDAFLEAVSIKILNESYYNVKAYGAVGDGVTDDTAAIQAAIDAADAAIVTEQHAPTVVFPPGVFSITSTLDSKRVHFLGSVPNQAVVLKWDGAAGGTMMTRTDQTSHFLLEGILFGGGANEPEVGITFSSGSAVDHFVLLNRLQFANISGDAIQLTDGWVNFRAYDIRWDNIGGYAIDATVQAGQNLSSFVIDRFAYDHNRASGPASGFVRFDNDVANVSNAGTVVINGGRIEVNTAWTGNQAIITAKVNNTPTGSNFLGFSITNSTYQDVSGMANDVVLYRDTTHLGGEFLIMKNFRPSGLSNAIGGTWVAGAFISLPVSSSYVDVISGIGIERGPLNDTNHVVFRSLATGLTAITFKTGTETGERLQIRGDGRLAWGDGTAAVDVVFSRSAADTLQLGSGDKLHLQNELELDGDLNHDGSNVGFFTTTPAAQPSTTAEIKAALSSLGLLQDGSATPLDLDGGALTGGSVEATAGPIEYTDAPTLAASTTPSVTGGNVFLTNSTASITDFTGEQNGQVIILLCEADTTTSLLDATPLFLAGGFTCTADDSITLVSNGTVWIELSRSVN